METSPLTPAEALAQIANVASKQEALHSRFEGIAWVLWGLVVALQAMTLGFLNLVDIQDDSVRHILGVVAHLWIIVGILASVGVWRAAAVNFGPGISRRRALGFFIALPATIHFLSFLISQATHGVAAFSLVAAGVLGLFALLNPVRFTKSGRITAAILATISALVGALLIVTDSTGDQWYALAGTCIGLSWILAGLIALYQG